MEHKPAHHRRVRSYVRREGRLTKAQQRALDELWPRWGVEYGSHTIDAPTLYGNDHPLHLEIGFGNGDALLHAAAAAPEDNFLGIEVHRPGVGHLLLGLESGELENVRVLCHDAVEVLERQVADASLMSVRIYFPDPWHKKRHHKRRLIQPPFVALLARKIRPGGFLHLATDWEPYTEHMLAAIMTCSAFVNRAHPGEFSERPDWRPETKFERRGLRLGHGVWDLIFSRKPDHEQD